MDKFRIKCAEVEGLKGVHADTSGDLWYQTDLLGQDSLGFLSLLPRYDNETDLMRVIRQLSKPCQVDYCVKLSSISGSEFTMCGWVSLLTETTVSQMRTALERTWHMEEEE